MVGWEHSGDEQTDDGFMFNMILQDGTRSDNSFTDDGYGEARKRYDYFLPQNKRITAVTIYYNTLNSFSTLCKVKLQYTQNHLGQT